MSVTSWVGTPAVLKPLTAATLQLPLTTLRSHPLPKSAVSLSCSINPPFGSPPTSAPCRFPTSRLPQALHLSHLANSAPSRFPTTSSSGTPLMYYGYQLPLPLRHLVFHFPTTSSSSTDTFNVHKLVAPTLPSGYVGRRRNLTLP